MSDYELFKNPVFLTFLIVLLILGFIYRRSKLVQSTKEQNKIGAFMLGFIPLRQSFYDYQNKRHTVSWVILIAIFLAVFAIGLSSVVKGRATLREALPILLFPTLLIAVWIQGSAYKKAKEKGVDTTGLGTTAGLGRFLTRGKTYSVKRWIRVDLGATIIVIVGLVLYFLFSS